MVAFVIQLSSSISRHQKHKYLSSEMYKVVTFLALVASVLGGGPINSAGVTYTYSSPQYSHQLQQPAASYYAPASPAAYSLGSSYPAAYHTVAAPAQVAYAPAQVQYAQAPAQVAYAQPAQVAYAQPALQVAQPVAYAQPVHQQVTYAAQPVVKAVAPVKTLVAAQPEPYDAHPQYSYSYSVSDSLTGDSKTASESRDGDVVKGQYSLVEPDGSLRVVTYTADSVNGFNAVVDRQAAKTVVAAPAVVKAVAPVQYAQAAPVQYAQAAPVHYAPAPVAHFAAAPAPVSKVLTPAFSFGQRNVVKAVAPAPFVQYGSGAQRIKTLAAAGPGFGAAYGGAVVSTSYGSPKFNYAY